MDSRLRLTVSRLCHIGNKTIHDSPTKSVALSPEEAFDDRARHVCKRSFQIKH